MQPHDHHLLPKRQKGRYRQKRSDRSLPPARQDEVSHRQQKQQSHRIDIARIIDSVFHWPISLFELLANQQIRYATFPKSKVKKLLSSRTHAQNCSGSNPQWRFYENSPDGLTFRREEPRECNL